VPELALDDEQRDAFARHLDRVGVAQLMGREPASYSCSGGGVVKL
jgi:ABC-type thiamine transport system ATPase subunit